MHFFRKFFFLSLFSFALFSPFATAQQPSLSWYLPDSITYDPSVPVPSSVLGFEVGEQHVPHDRLVQYMYAVAAASGRVTVQEYGRTYEERPLLYVIITAPENKDRLEEMRRDHLALCDPARSGDIDPAGVPLVVLLSYTIHGNEASGANASLLTVYHLAAAQDPNLEAFLKNNIIIVDPTINPDGYSRFSEWVISRKGLHPSPDPVSDEFNEPWPRGRGNHYWFDMNRDYTLLVNRESRARVRQFYRWRPNIVTDHHEMGSAATFFFQPGIPSRNNPVTPQKNYDLTARIAQYHARYLDRLGSQYFTEESFDDYYYGKGSSFPDVNGGIGILFEQASVRGHVRETSYGRLTFPFAIRNQLTVSLSTLAAARDLHDELLTYQKEFFLSALREAEKAPVKGYVFGDPSDITRTRMLVRLLQAHQIEVHSLKKDFRAGGTLLTPASGYLVPARQPQYRLVRTLFEKNTRFRDSTFYDVSTWTFPLAYNMPCQAVTEEKMLTALAGDRVSQALQPTGKVTGEMSRYGYLFTWDEYNTPRLLYRILAAGLRARVAMAPFTYDDGSLKKKFTYGTIFVPVQNQQKSPRELYDFLRDQASRTGVDIYPVSTGLTGKGIDLGSRFLAPLEMPRPLLLTGSGVSSLEAGEIWQYLDRSVALPLTMVDLRRAGNIDLTKYNVLILAGGSYGAISSSFGEQLKAWVRKGGTVVALKSANRYLAQLKLAGVQFKSAARPDSSRHYPYEQAYRGQSLQRISGAIFSTRMELSHPLAYGYVRDELPVFRNSTLAARNVKAYYHQPVRYTENPLLSGYVSQQNIKRISGSPEVIITPQGQGRVISFIDDPLFRGYFCGTHKMFANAILFRQLIR